MRTVLALGLLVLGMIGHAAADDAETARRAEGAAARAEAAADRSEAAAARVENAIGRLERLLDEMARRQARHDKRPAPAP